MLNVAIGDLQAPIDAIRAVLDRHNLLVGERIRAGARLVCVGDYFDWGSKRARGGQPADEGARLLGWLASHGPEQVILILGNHDLARVGALAGFDAAEWASAYAEACDIYYDLPRGQARRTASRAFSARWPAAPSAQIVARDFASFKVDQRALLIELLRAGRFRLSWAAAPDLLVCHAGFTGAELAAMGLPAGAGARAIAAASQAALERAVASWDEGAPLHIPGLHTPGGAGQEGTGAIFHRPADPDSNRMGGRRYDPRDLPGGLTQVIGHNSDKKCRDLMPRWSRGEPAGKRLRHLRIEDGAPIYEAGPPPEDADARLLLIDGGLGRGSDDDYELLDLDTRRPLIV